MLCSRIFATLNPSQPIHRNGCRAMEFARTAGHVIGLADDSYTNHLLWSNIMRDVLWISLGAIAGANLRYGVARLAARFLSSTFPYSTLFINVTGSFILGFFMVWTSERVLADPKWRLLVAVGFCGAYTTFSSYAFETMAYFQQGQW